MLSYFEALENRVFILGSPRSGTTFLGRAIGGLPGVVYCHEPFLTKMITGYIYRERIPGGFSRFLYTTVAAVHRLAYPGSARMILEKTPRNCTIADFLSIAFPQARFLHIVRDPRDAAASHREQPWLVHGTDRLPRLHPYRFVWGSRPRYWVEPERIDEFRTTSDVGRIAWEWRRYNQWALSLRNLADPQRYRRLRYEDLSGGNGMALARELCGFLHIQDSRSVETITRNLDAFSGRSIGRWRRDLTSRQCQDIEQEAGELMTELGYVH